MKRKILVVEADQSIQEVVTIILERAGYEVAISKDGNCRLEDGWTHPDAYLIGIQTVGDKSSKLCLHLKASEVSQYIPVILMSTVMHLEEMAKAVGADAIVAKPFSMAGLIDIVERVINRSTTHRVRVQ